MIIFFLGIGIALLSPLLRRWGKSSMALACGVGAVLTVAIIGLAHPDPRIGAAALDANRRQYLFVLACEMPVFILALISLKRSRWTFWLGWAIHSAFAACVAVIAVWLEFFWHW